MQSERLKCSVTFLCASILVATISCPASAADTRGCADAGGLKRFAGSSIVICEKRDFAEYTLPTGKNLSYDFDTNKATFEAALSLEGRLNQNVYAAPVGASAAEVFRNYQTDLAAKG